MKFLTTKNGYIVGLIASILLCACWYRLAHVEHRNGQHSAYLQANSLEASGRLGAASAKYSHLCDVDFYPVPENMEGTCRAVERLGKVIAAGLAETTAALEAYKQEHGVYPEHLVDIRGRLNAVTRVLIKEWTYCKKTDLNAEGGKCDDGSAFVSRRPFVLINR